ncbi:uncharacterized protein J8A68_005064 [[Candida] subhashii]|uniref:NADH dehydrogenase [ubiquinone] 1 alpha subcomplex assembly factor 3 n=1 Tax=[Candida] subhashii TaxID=561895 RepID=A0A8J5UJY5_9ASCO|nr:uncharacterized protein J8A68_005064 [[Candida] subhashii]KAG7661486.1 hypothetical protein J8A68_005064 [[Candida] subhashii]
MQRTFLRQLSRSQARLGLFSKSSSQPARASPLFTPPPDSTPQVRPSNAGDLFKKNDILMYADKPLNYIESLKPNGFHLANTLLITSPNSAGNVNGLVLIDTETILQLNPLRFQPLHIQLKGQNVLNVFERVHPKPEILVIGLGKKSRMLSGENRRFLLDLGIGLEVSHTANAVDVFDLLSTERPHVIGALMLPPNV